jgi:hypothetical protein
VPNRPIRDDFNEPPFTMTPPPYQLAMLQSTPSEITPKPQKNFEAFGISWSYQTLMNQQWAI